MSGAWDKCYAELVRKSKHHYGEAEQHVRDTYHEAAETVDRHAAEGRAEVERLTAALEQSVKLQSHYAKTLNGHDGGERLAFKDAQAWLDRLATPGVVRWK